MDVELMNWKDEMDNMLAAINRQTTHSLRVIKSIFKRCGRSFSPNFKQYFLQTSCDSIKLAYEQFEIDSLHEESMNAIWDTEDAAPIGDSSSENLNETVSDTIAIQNTSVAYSIKDRPVVTDNLHGINESISYQSKTNESHSTDPEASSDLNFAVESYESDDSIEMVENQNASIDVDDKELVPMTVVLNRLEETSTSKLTTGKSEATRLNRKNPQKKLMIKTMKTKNGRDSLTTKGEKSLSKQISGPGNSKRCTVCGYVALHMGNLNRHMRTHTGEKPHRCNLCEKRFKTSNSFIKHAATHIAEFPFHCRACFHGFSLKTEAAAHEKYCMKRHYECYLCKKYVTADKGDLTTHMRTHTGDKPFRCGVCMTRFVQKAHVKTHLKTIHSRNDLSFILSF